MSNPFGTDPIETLDDWNSYLSCCCSMPSCPVPTKVCESVTFVPCVFEDEGSKYKTRITVEDGWKTTTETYAPERDEDGYCVLISTCSGVRVTTTTNSFDNSGFTDPDPDFERWYSARAGTDVLVLTTTANPDCSECSVYSGSYTVSGIVELIYEEGVPYYVDEIYHTYSGTVVDGGECSDDYDYTYDGDGSPWGTPWWSTLDLSDEYWAEDAFSDSYTVEPPGAADVTTYEDPFTNADLITGLEEFALPDDADGTLCTAALVDLTSATKARYRWQIPVTHLGSYFKITWDVLTEPTEYGVWKPLKDAFDAATAAHAAWVTAGSIGTAPAIPDDPGAAPTPLATIEADLTWEWTGPGTGLQTDASWYSGWYDLAPPDDEGTRRVINVRYECYRGPFGHKPQTTGEAYELPA